LVYSFQQNEKNNFATEYEYKRRKTKSGRLCNGVLSYPLEIKIKLKTSEQQIVQAWHKFRIIESRALNYSPLVYQALIGY